MTTTHEPEVDVEAAGERVSAILHPNGQDRTVNMALEGAGEETGPPKSRKKRADAGKSRETFYVSIPGVRFDMNSEEGRTAIKTWIAQQGASPCVDDIYDQLLREIDRLRAK